MDVDLETTEDFVDGVWVPVERNVLHVDKLYRPEAQGALPLPPPEKAIMHFANRLMDSRGPRS